MKKVTTITPCHNSTKYLKECWDSLKNQTIGLSNMECIFVDDASDDDGATWKMLLEFEQEKPDSVIVIHLDENLRQGGARNIALSYATGEYVQFLDSDDTLEREALEGLYDRAIEYDADFIQYGCTHRGEEIDSPASKKVFFYDLKSPLDRKEMLIAGKLNCSHHTRFYHRDLLAKSGVRFAEHLIFEEPLFVYPLFYYANRILILPEKYYCFQTHSESTMGGEARELLFDHVIVQQMTFEYMREHKDWYEIYQKEIHFYFLWTFFVETVINAGRGGRLTLEHFYFMQRYIHKNAPDYEYNIHLYDLGEQMHQIMEGVDMEMSMQKELDTFCKRANEIYEEMHGK